MQTNRICRLFNIRYPVIQGGMVWCSGWKLASAVSNAGGLGLIGSGSMTPELLREHIRKARQATSFPFGINIPLMHKYAGENINVVLQEKVEIVFTSAGNPKTYTGQLKENGVTVAHVVSNEKFAIKSEEAGVDAIVAEGFEAGGHNGKEETTTIVLIPMIRKCTKLPLIAAGGIATGAAMLSAMVLGADGVQIGSRFAASVESSAHIHFKEKIVHTGDGDTQLTMKKLVPVRLIKNTFYNQIEALENSGAPAEAMKALLGHGRAQKGMFEGDMDEGELEIGQVAALIEDILPAKEIMNTIINEYHNALHKVTSFD